MARDSQSRGRGEQSGLGADRMLRPSLAAAGSPARGRSTQGSQQTHPGPARGGRVPASQSQLCTSPGAALQPPGLRGCPQT